MFYCHGLIENTYGMIILGWVLIKSGYGLIVSFLAFVTCILLSYGIVNKGYVLISNAHGLIDLCYVIIKYC